MDPLNSPASYEQLKAGLARFAPHIQVDDALDAELRRRANEGATLGMVLQDAQGYRQLGAGANSYVQPYTQQAVDAAQNEQDVAQSNADQQTTLAKTNAQRIQDALGVAYNQQRQDDPLRRQGIVSGAADQYNTEQRANNYRYAAEDLGNQLSAIAQNLGNAKLSTTRAINTANITGGQQARDLVETMRSNLATAPYTLRNEANTLTTQGQGIQSNAADIYQKLQSAFYPNPIPQKLLQSLGVLGG